MHKLTVTESQALLVAAKAINCDPLNLQAVIEFESAWFPLARNAQTGARGLIQFMPATARSMFFDSADQLVLLLPNSESQLLGPVIRFFRNVSTQGFSNLQAVAMGVFYPAFRYESETREFPELVQKQNPGIRTVADYVNKVRSRMA